MKLVNFTFSPSSTGIGRKPVLNSFYYFQHLSPMSQYILQNTVAQKCLQHFIPDSTDSLHSFSSDLVCIPD